MIIDRVRVRVNPVTTLAIVLLVGAVIYVAAAWSPSSYGKAFNLFGLDGLGLVLGKPRAIRTDEWAVITPLTQATVNNGFARFNLTSPYREDLRSVYSMPIADWGIIFKPDMWLYSVANPAYAYSFHHYLIFAAFLSGYALLFANVIGLPQLTACLLSGLLFFTGYVQYWWTTLGPVFAFFPWLIVVLDWRVRWWIKSLVFSWIAIVWMLAFFYPPTMITLAFVGFLILLAFRSNYLKSTPLVYLVLASGAAVLITGWYLHDYLIDTLSTVYPGQRVITNGGGVAFEQWISQFFPVSQILRHNPLLEGTNICEVSTVGTTYVVAVLCFLDYSKWQSQSNAFKRSILILTSGLLATWIWILVPLPAWIVTPILWNRVQPSRMFFAAGLLLLIVITLLAHHLGLKMSRVRVGVLAAVTIAVWIIYKLNRSALDLRDILILVTIVGFAVAPKFLDRKFFNSIVLTSACLIGIISFGSFNPIQSAWHIFNRPDTVITRELDRRAAQNPDNIILMTKFPGAILNGWGYRSISHLLPAPEFAFFRQYFPQLPEPKFKELFNRYAHIQLTFAKQPAVVAPDAIDLPIRVFAQPSQSNVQN